MNNIYRASIITDITHMLNEDIKTLSQISMGANSSDELQSLIDSIIESKQNILHQLPDDSLSVVTRAHPPKRKNTNNYGSSDTANDKGPKILASIFLDIEQSQQKLIEHAVESDGIPQKISSILVNVLSIYQKITSQLYKTITTNQLNSNKLKKKILKLQS